MSILNELSSYMVNENVTELHPKGVGKPHKSSGEIEIGRDVAQDYQSSIRDCKEHSSIDGTTEMIFDSLRKVDLMPYTNTNQEWLGGYTTDLKVGDSGVAKLNLRSDNNAVVNAYLKIELYRTTDDEYEVSTRIVMK